MADGQEAIIGKYRTCNYFLAKNLLHTGSNTSSDTSNGLKPNFLAAADRRSSYQPVHDTQFEPKKISGFRACDPITVLDDDESDAVEIIYIDLDNDDKVPTKEKDTAPIKQAVAGTHDPGFQSVVQSHSPCNNTQTPDSAGHTDDCPAPSVQSEPEDWGIGLKAWYRPHDSNSTGNAALAMQQKRTSQTSSITLFDGERTKNATRRRRDVPQFPMNVLIPKSKRTIGELDYDELISPAQIESLSEKLARVAKKRRQYQERGAMLSQNTKSGDEQSAMDFDHVYGRGSDRMAGESVELAVSPIAYESLERRKAVARVGDEPTRPSVVREPAPISPYPSTEDRRYLLTTQRRKDHSDSHMDAYDISVPQTTGQDCDAQEHGDGINAAYSGNSASRKPRDRKPRVGGPTSACGVLSPEKKPPVKRFNQASFPYTKPKLDHAESPVEHRATAGKGLSQETLKRYLETGDWNCGMEVDQNADEAHDEETEIPDIAYHYFVQKREWLETEEDAIEASLGPFFTMTEANTVAKAEVQLPQIDGFEKIRSNGWSYFYQQDENGMQTHVATVLEIHIETAVHHGKC